MKKLDLVIGIDPGVKTGYAVWDCLDQKFIKIETFGIVKAMKEVKIMQPLKLLRFEDSRLRTGYFGKNAHLKQQGAGSIKRDCSIWQEFCEYHGIKYEVVKPAKGATKWNSDYFKRVTGWDRRTSEHARDAAVLVFGEK